MQLFYLALIGLLLFLSLAFLRKWFDSFILIAFSIGAACNANYYHSFTTPVTCGNLVFAIDSILFTLFLHTIIVKYLHYSLKEAKNMAIASIVAILISAVIEFLAKCNSVGYSISLLNNFVNYCISALSSLIGIWLMIMVLEKTKSWNVYVRIFVAILVGGFIDSTIYYIGVSAAYNLNFSSLWGVLVGSYIGKFYAILLAQLIYFINGTIWVPTDLKKINYHNLEGK